MKIDRALLRARALGLLPAVCVCMLALSTQGVVWTAARLAGSSAYDRDLLTRLVTVRGTLQEPVGRNVGVCNVQDTKWSYFVIFVSVFGSLLPSCVLCRRVVDDRFRFKGDAADPGRAKVTPERHAPSAAGMMTAARIASNARMIRAMNTSVPGFGAVCRPPMLLSLSAVAAPAGSV